MEMEMEGEVRRVVQMCVLVTAAVCYCHLVVGRVFPPGKLRLLSLLPVLYLFTRLPLLFSSVHLRGTSGFFLTWLANFKLLLFAFSQGPLSRPDLSFPVFLAVASLPINPDDDSRTEQKTKPRAHLLIPHPRIIHVGRVLGFALKGLLLALLISHYPRRHEYHRTIVLALYALHMYLALDVLLATVAVFSRILLPAARRMKLEPQFSAPYLSTSLQDFWGRRWNLMVTRILRPAVYVPVRSVAGTSTAAVAAFFVSGLMHELIFYYLTLERPTGEVTAFFVLQGATVALEVAAKRTLGRKGWRALPAVVAAPLTLAYVWVTGLWLFFPAVLRGGTEERVIEECTALLEAGRGALHLIQRR